MDKVKQVAAARDKEQESVNVEYGKTPIERGPLVCDQWAQLETPNESDDRHHHHRELDRHQRKNHHAPRLGDPADKVTRPKGTQPNCCGKVPIGTITTVSGSSTAKDVELHRFQCHHDLQAGVTGDIGIAIATRTRPKK